MKQKLKKLAVLASGNGTTLQAIIDAIKNYDYMTQEKVIGSIVTHQLIALLVYVICSIKNNGTKKLEERMLSLINKYYRQIIEQLKMIQLL